MVRGDVGAAISVTNVKALWCSGDLTRVVA